MRCAIVYPLFALYRVPIFQALVDTQTDDMEFCVFFDPTHKSSIKKANPDLSQGKKWRAVKNINLGFGFVWQWGVLKIALGREFDTLIVLGDAYIVTNWILALICRLRGKKILFWTHGMYGNESKFKLLVRKTFYRLAHGFLLYGNLAKQLMVKNGFKPKNLHVIFNSLDFEKQQQVASTLREEDLQQTKRELFKEFADAPVMIFIGRLIARKRLEMLIDACKKLDERGLSVNVLFVGDGTERGKLESRVSELGLEGRVVFSGPKYEEEEIGSLMQISSICVSPGDIGLTAIHTLTYGVPVITHDNFADHGPEFEAIQPGINGDFFRQGDVDSLANKIESWLRKHPVLDANLKSHCAEVVAKYFNPGFQKQLIEKAVQGNDAEINSEIVLTEN